MKLADVAAIEQIRDIIPIFEERWNEDGTERAGRPAGRAPDGTELVEVSHPGQSRYTATMKDGSVVEISQEEFESLLRESREKKRGEA